MNAVLEAIVHKILKFYQRYNILLLNLQLLLRKEGKHAKQKQKKIGTPISYNIII